MRIGVVCRWKPVHLAHAAMLDALCARADEVLVGIGSPNRYDLRNPFRADETRGMLEAYLAPRWSNARLLEVEDLGHGPRWRALVQESFGPLDLFVSANDYVRGLMAPVYPLAHPRDLVDPARHTPIDGTRVRRALARGDAGWAALVPDEVAGFMTARGLPERFRREFGLATLLDEVGALLPPAARPEERQEGSHVLLG